MVISALSSLTFRPSIRPSSGCALLEEGLIEGGNSDMRSIVDNELNTLDAEERHASSGAVRS